MMPWKEKKILHYVNEAKDYIRIWYSEPQQIHYSVSEDEEEVKTPGEKPPVNPDDNSQLSTRPDVHYQRRSYSNFPDSDAKYSERDYGAQYSERDYGVQYSERDYGDSDDLFDDKAYSMLRSVLRSNPDASLEMLNRYVSPTFVDTLLKYIDQRNLKDSQVYKAAGIDRRLFSKIVSDRSYKPARDTCIALCIGLRLNLTDASRLLERAGYKLSHSNKRDIAIEFFLVEGEYKIQEINEVLDRLGLKILGRE